MTATSWAVDSGPSLPAAGTPPIASDSYDRQVSSGFGSADVGGAYRISQSQGVQSSVAAGAAQVTGLAPGKSFHATLPSVTAADMVASVVLNLPADAAAPAGFYYGLDLRSGKGWTYRAKVRIGKDSVGIRLARVGPGVDTTLAASTVNVDLTGSTSLVVQAAVSGTTPELTARAWALGSAKPDWQTRYTDKGPGAITTSGSVGTWAYVPAGSDVSTFTQSALQVVSSDDPSPADPTPTVSPSTPAPTTTTPSPQPTTPPESSSSPVPVPTTPPPPPPPSDPPTGSRGAAPVGTAAYAVPAGALIVSPNGNDSAQGSLGAPLRTVAQAVSKVAVGQTIVLRGGTYHESITVPAAKQNITIQAYPNEAVWFDGSSPVTSWTQSGGDWVHSGWTAQFDHSASFTYGKGGPESIFLGPQNPMAAWPDAVWLDQTQLKQVGSEASVVPGTFFVDYAGDRIVVGSDPSGHSLRASDLVQAFKVLAPGVKLQGFGVSRYATPLPALGAVRLQGGSDTIRDLVVTQNATQGVSFQKSSNLADHVTSTMNGMVGIHGNTADDLTIRNSVLTGNNAQLFNTSPSAAGVKITRSRGVTIDNNLFDGNHANGLWLDESVVRFTVVNNTFSDNHIGLQAELSDTGTVANNVFSAAEKYGLYIYDTGNVRVFNNSFVNDPYGAVFISQDARRQANASDPGHDPRYAPGDATDPWLVRNITLSNNLFHASVPVGKWQVYILDKSTHIAADKMNITIDGNEFASSGGSSGLTMVGWGGGDNVTITRYETPAALSAAKNPSWQNLQDGGAARAALVSQNSAAVPLPPDIAGMIGVVAGTTHIGPF